MEITLKTKIADLLNAYPFLLQFLIEKSDHFENLKNPIMRNTMGKVASVEKVAVIAGIDPKALLDEMKQVVAAHSGKTEDAQGQGAAEEAQALSDPAARQAVLKGIIKDLHAGEDMQVLKDRFQALIAHVSPTEIAKMEHALIQEGMPASEVKRLCDVHVAVFKEALEKHAIPGAPAGHPVHTFMLENRACEEVITGINSQIKKLKGLKELGQKPAADLFEKQRAELAGLLKQLSEIHIHYLRKENQLFPMLEAHEISGPSQVMWSIHDDIRTMLKAAKADLESKPMEVSIASLEKAMSAITEMIYKEENILFPMSMEALTDAEWEKVRNGEEEIGYAWVQPAAQPGATAKETPIKTIATGKLQLDTGALSADLINLMLTHLPFDLTLVDAEDRVAYYSRGEERIFPRSPGIIGRKVQNCHPPKSLDVVEKILAAFKEGKKDSEAFWIQMGENFIYIRYFALRDADGLYQGCLEVSQEVSDIRKLKGQKRLLDRE